MKKEQQNIILTFQNLFMAIKKILRFFGFAKKKEGFKFWTGEFFGLNEETGEYEWYKFETTFNKPFLFAEDVRHFLIWKRLNVYPDCEHPDCYINGIYVYPDTFAIRINPKANDPILKQVYIVQDPNKMPPLF